MLQKLILGFTLWLLSFLCIFLVLKTSDEPVVEFFANTTIESVLLQFPTGNSIVFNLSIGFLVSVFFYVLVVWIPERRRKNLLKHNFQQHYKMLKEDLIAVLLLASDGKYSGDLPKKLSEQNEFQKYFKEQVAAGQERWHAVANGLDQKTCGDVLVNLELLMNEVSFVLNNIPINDAKVLSFFKRLSQSVYRLKNSTAEYDDIKSLLSFLWDLLAGWSFIDGYRKNDIVRIMISKI